jgi:hypothetical protein
MAHLGREDYTEILQGYFKEGNGTKDEPYECLPFTTIVSSIQLLGSACAPGEVNWFIYQGYKFSVNRDYIVDSFQQEKVPLSQPFESVWRVVEEAGAEVRAKEMKKRSEQSLRAAELQALEEPLFDFKKIFLGISNALPWNSRTKK